MAALIENLGAGIAVEPEDAADISAGVLRLKAEGRESMVLRGQSGLAFYRSHMSRATGSAKLANILREAAKRGAR